jgi:hypothetical protein
MEFIRELIGWIIGRPIRRGIFSLIGWIYLHIRLRNKGKVKKLLSEEYENSFGEAGFTILTDTFGFIYITALILCLLGVIVSIIWRGLS